MSQRSIERLTAGTLVVLAGLWLVALVSSWPSALSPSGDQGGETLPMNEPTEVRIKGILCMLALLAAVWRHLPWRGLPPRRAGAVLVLAGVVAVAAYYNFGKFHGRTFVHYWEHFHYFLGSEYFPELGYDSLYAASAAAQKESRPDLPEQAIFRDLRTNEVVPAAVVVDHSTEVVDRFSAERWAQFLADHEHFLAGTQLAYMAQIRKDHGFNPPPSWTFTARLMNRLARLVSREVGISRGSLRVLASLDVLLLALMFMVIFHTWGSRTGCLSLVLFGLSYAGRFYWIGGAFLRLDWLVAVVVGIALVERRRYLPAGLLFGYATMVRIFPVLFLFGPAVLLVKALLRGERPRWIRDLALGFALGVALAFLAGCMTGRGVHAWAEFFDSVRLHRQTWLTNNVGLDNLVLYGPSPVMMDGRWVDRRLPEPWIHWQEEMDRRHAARYGPIWAARIALLALLAAAVWRARRAEAVLLGMVAVFALTILTCYYWIMLLAVPFQRSLRVVLGAIVLQLFAFGVHLWHPAFEMRYGMMSWALAALFAVWLVPEAFSSGAASTECPEDDP